ncbi:helix-turn-helix transcriptional regulator [Paenibacillus sp. FSL W8-0919]|uniref:helix-turn-helix domain-containing protein n=1 Tax=Paenibacillus sp. FSL W8-0919 TaxID=2954707 RepID=UPI0030F7A311
MEQSTLKIIGSNVRKRRKLKGMTQEQLADLAGMSFSYLGKIERGEYNVKIQTLEKVAKALECSLAALLSDSAAFKDVEMTEPVLEAAAILLKESDENQRKAVDILRFIFRTEK